MERVPGLEPGFTAWKAVSLPIDVHPHLSGGACQVRTGKNRLQIYYDPNFINAPYIVRAGIGCSPTDVHDFKPFESGLDSRCPYAILAFHHDCRLIPVGLRLL
jgi:hypothetical protein